MKTPHCGTLKPVLNDTILPSKTYVFEKLPATSRILVLLLWQFRWQLRRNCLDSNHF